MTLYRSVINCKKVNVRFLAKLNQDDQRTVLGRKLQTLSILAKCGYDNLNASAIKKTWRLPLL